MFVYPKTPDEDIEHYKMLYNSGIIVWHCEVGGRGRHGTILKVKREHLQDILRMLNWYLGNKAVWTKKNADNTTSLEFVYQGNTTYKRPWHYCGTTILFKENQVAEENNYSKLAEFHLDDEVMFEFRGRLITGHIANLRKRATVVSNGQKFYVPANQLRKVNG